MLKFTVASNAHQMSDIRKHFPWIYHNSWILPRRTLCLYALF